MRVALFIAAATGALLISVTAAAQPPGGVVHTGRQPGESLTDWGQELFAGNCAACHGPLGAGATADNPIHGAGDISGYGPDLRGVGARAADFHLRTGRMPLDDPTDQPERDRPLYSPREIRAMTAFVASLGKGPKIPHPDPHAGTVSKGYTSFADHCAGCHQIVGEGGYVTGARVPVLEHATPTQIAEAVRIGPYVMPRFSRDAISKPELNALIAYIRASRKPNDRGGQGLGHIGPVPEGLVAWLVAAGALVGVCIIIGSRVRS
jgi:ubiquinol-cytochrome c reductase cytochrome c subunit